MGDANPFNGDGMVTAFRFKNGHVDMQHRYVRTHRFNAERAARCGLFGDYRNPFTDEPSVKGVQRTVSNTNVVPHNGMLLAMKEDGPPYAMDPHTLETRQLWDWQGQMTATTFTAHPKIDPDSGDLVGYAYAAKGEASRTSPITPSTAAAGRPANLVPGPARGHDPRLWNDGKLCAADPGLVWAQGQNRINAYTVLRDERGAPLALLATSAPRRTYALGFAHHLGPARYDTGPGVRLMGRAAMVPAAPAQVLVRA